MSNIMDGKEKFGIGRANSDVDTSTKRSRVVQWLNTLFADFNMPTDATEEELRAQLIDGTVLCAILNRKNPGSIQSQRGVFISSEHRVDNLRRFLLAMDKMGLPRFSVSDLERGSMSAVVECLLCFRDRLSSGLGEDVTKSGSQPRKKCNLVERDRVEPMDVSQGNPSLSGSNSPALGEERRKSFSESKFQRAGRSPVMPEASSALVHHAGNKFHEVFQLKQGRYADLPAAKISEMMKSNSLDNAPTQSLLSVVNGILDESIERKNEEIPHRVACLLRKVVQEIERRISTQAEHIRNQNNAIKAREVKYQSRIRVLETLASGTSEETQIVTNQLQTRKTEKTKIEKTKKHDQDVVRLMKEKEDRECIISKLKQELEMTNKRSENRCQQLENDIKEIKVQLEEKIKEAEILLLESKKKTKYSETTKKHDDQDMVRLMKEKEDSECIISKLKQELEMTNKRYENRCQQLENDTKEIKVQLEEKIKEAEILLLESKNKTKYSETTKKHDDQDMIRLMKEKEDSECIISELKMELEMTNKRYEARCQQLENNVKEINEQLEEKVKEAEILVVESKKRIKELDVTRKHDDQDMGSLIKEKEDSECIISELKQELEMTNKRYENRCQQLENDAKEMKVQLEEKIKEAEILLIESRKETKYSESTMKHDDQDMVRLMKEKEDSECIISELKQELEMTNKRYETRSQQLESDTKEMKVQREEKIQEAEILLIESRKRIKELEATKKHDDQEMVRLMKEKEDSGCIVSELKQELEMTNKRYETRCQQLENNTKEIKMQLEEKVTKAEILLIGSKKRIKELEVTRKHDNDQDMVRLMKEKEDSEHIVSELKQELEMTNKRYETRSQQLENDAKEMKVQLEEKIQEAEILLIESRKRIKELETTKKHDDQDMVRLTKEKEDSECIISELKQELEMTNKRYETRSQQLENDAKEMKVQLEEKIREAEILLIESRKRIKELEATKKHDDEDLVRLTKAKEDSEFIISELKEELEVTNKRHENRCQKLENDAKEIKVQMDEKIKEAGILLIESRKRTKELEAFFESELKNWKKKEHVFQNYIGFQLELVKNLRLASESTKGELFKSQKGWKEEMSGMGLKLKVLVDAAENYRTVLAENRRLYNEIQELKGNIRVYCRIRPFLPGQTGKSSTVDYIGDNGEVVLVNPSKQGKDARRLYKFDKVYGPSSTQEQVYVDTQPLVRSVVDGYNVCIFAYGQTGSGKTYTMMGPNSPSKEDWGVNYRALSDLFQISQTRSSMFLYEIGVQMVEVYNEQVRDLLTSDASKRRLGILTTSQPSGLAVPDATMLPVTSTSDVLELMQFGLTNRAMSSTAMNERSSRSHSVVTIYVKGADLKSGSTSRGCLHLIDLAGSERIDRSEVIGDRLKEAQHINKSLSALGDVIFALAQKSSHVPYRNSKLTQLLQSSLGGQAKTLMFVQVNPDAESHSESTSTLKFAERVSGIELGAAKSSKDGKDVRDLMEQVASLKDTIARKDEEIEQLQLLKDLGTQAPNGNNSMRHSSSSPGISQRGQRLLGGKVASSAASDPENSSEFSDRHSEAGSVQSAASDDLKPQKEMDEGIPVDELASIDDADLEERLTDISDGLSIEAENDSSERAEFVREKTAKAPAGVRRPLSQKTGVTGQTTTSTRPKSRDSLQSSAPARKITPRLTTTVSAVRPFLKKSNPS